MKPDLFYSLPHNPILKPAPRDLTVNDELKLRERLEGACKIAKRAFQMFVSSFFSLSFNHRHYFFLFHKKPNYRAFTIQPNELLWTVSVLLIAFKFTFIWAYSHYIQYTASSIQRKIMRYGFPVLFTPGPLTAVCCCVIINQKLHSSYLLNRSGSFR